MRGRTPFLALALLAAGAGGALAEPNAAEELGMVQTNFAQGTLSIDYCEKVFGGGTGPMHLVLLWHGASGKGDDNLTQLATPSLRPLLAYLETNAIRAVVLVPQCPGSASGWLGGGKTSPLLASRALVLSKASEWGVPPERTFFAGISMGGTAAYPLFAKDNPPLFGRAVVCSGGGNTNLASSVGTAVRAFNGTEDTVVDPAAGRAMAEAIAASGGDARYFELAGFDHFTAADVAFGAEQWDWFFGRESPYASWLAEAGLAASLHPEDSTGANGCDNRVNYAWDILPTAPDPPRMSEIRVTEDGVELAFSPWSGRRSYTLLHWQDLGSPPDEFPLDLDASDLLCPCAPAPRGFFAVAAHLPDSD